LKLKRRSLLKLGLAQSLFSFVKPGKIYAKNQSEFEKFDNTLKEKPSILQGLTDETSTQFSILDPLKRDLKISVFEEDSLYLSNSGKILLTEALESFNSETISFNSSLPRVHKEYFENLNKNTNYKLVVSESETNEILDQRTFTTLDLNKENFKFAFGSCMDDSRHEKEIWTDLENQRPDLFIFLGDSVYADKDNFGDYNEADPQKLWERFCRARFTLEFYYLDHLVPSLATWDDHDMGKNDAHSESYAYIKESQDNFLSFFAQNNLNSNILERGPGISSALKIGDHLMFLMDDRSFRKPKDSNDRYAHWGKEQEDWMLEKLNNHKGLSWLMNGTQMFPQMIFKESFSKHHPQNFTAMINELKKTNTKTIFCSGDVHFSEISKIDRPRLGYKSYELTSSSIHSLARVPPWLIPNPLRIEREGKRNYLLIETSMFKPRKIDVTCRAHNKIHFRRTLEV